MTIKEKVEKIEKLQLSIKKQKETIQRALKSGVEKSNLNNLLKRLKNLQAEQNNLLDDEFKLSLKELVGLAAHLEGSRTDHIRVGGDVFNEKTCLIPHNLRISDEQCKQKFVNGQEVQIDFTGKRRWVLTSTLWLDKKMTNGKKLADNILVGRQRYNEQQDVLSWKIEDIYLLNFYFTLQEVLSFNEEGKLCFENELNKAILEYAYTFEMLSEDENER